MTSYITPIAVELLVREAQSLRGYAWNDRRTLRYRDIEAELARLGASDALDEDDEDGPGPDLNPEGDPTRNGAFA